MTHNPTRRAGLVAVAAALAIFSGCRDDGSADTESQQVEQATTQEVETEASQDAEGDGQEAANCLTRSQVAEAVENIRRHIKDAPGEVKRERGAVGHVRGRACADEEPATPDTAEGAHLRGHEVIKALVDRGFVESYEVEDPRPGWASQFRLDDGALLLFRERKKGREILYANRGPSGRLSDAIKEIAVEQGYDD